MKRADEEPTPEAIDTAIFQDPLRRHGEVERFLQMLLAVEPPYTILVNAPWGSGKTFFIKQIERVLRMAIRRSSRMPKNLIRHLVTQQKIF